MALAYLNLIHLITKKYLKDPQLLPTNLNLFNNLFNGCPFINVYYRL
jgi:hypothetical protein